MSVFDAKKNIRILKQQDYQKSLWKNGQGQTQQIAIFPESADFQKDPFLWRLSSATISNHSNFSTYKNYDRLLTVINNPGVILNDTHLSPLTVQAFSGEVAVYCHLINGPVDDLGLIYSRDHVCASMKVKTLSASDSIQEINLSEAIHFLFCVNGDFVANEFHVQEKDTLRIEKSGILQVLVKKPTTYIHIKIIELSQKPNFCESVYRG